MRLKEDKIFEKIDSVIKELESIGMNAKEMEDLFKISMVEYYRDNSKNMTQAAKNANVSKRCFYYWYDKEMV